MSNGELWVAELAPARVGDGKERKFVRNCPLGFVFQF